MNRFIAATLVFGLGVCVAGCNIIKGKTDTGPTDVSEKAIFSKREPTTAELVGYLNDNSRRVQAVQCTQVTMDCKQGNEVPVGINAMLACQKPRQFRLKGTLAGSDVVDLGSNDDEFWYWIGKADPHVFHCAYKDMATGQVRLPIPFNPDMVVCALNMGEYNPNAQYDLRKYPDRYELIEPTKSMQGQDVFKVTVFNRGQVTAERPRVLAYVLRDQKGKDICTAVIKEAQVNKETGAVLPSRVQLIFNAEKASERSELTMRFYDLKVMRTGFERDRATSLFTRNDLSYPGYDLARQAPDRTTGSSMSIQRTGGVIR